MKKKTLRTDIVILLSLFILFASFGCGPLQTMASSGQDSFEQEWPDTDGGMESNIEFASEGDSGLYTYNVGDACFECSIDIYDYIYEKDGYNWVDMPKMVEDAGYEVEPDWQNASNWSGRAICDVDGGVIIITLKKGTTQVNEKYKNVDIIATQLFPSRQDNHALATYYVTRNSLENCEYRISKMTTYGVSLDQIKIAAYALSTARWEGVQLNSEPFSGLDKNNADFYLIP